ncbi:MAG: 1,4-alpha-glucan branching protein GlgB [Balneolaceae bacterium]|nr:1,4-alpha-glucan branching protein GlgB [Balneolaceae bacterium]
MEGNLLDHQQIQAISHGDHGDPFSVLGMNYAQVDHTAGIVVRAMLPAAQRVWVKNDEKGSTELNRISEQGLFEGILKDQEEFFDYTFRVRPYHGEEYEMHDPYSFESLLSDYDLQLWGEGSHRKAYEWMGSHLRQVGDVKGTHFVVTAPSASRVSVIGSFNDWDGRIHPMRKLHNQGLWELFIPEVSEGDLYKYEIKPSNHETPLVKADPYAFYAEEPPGTASKVYDLSGYDWQDQDWMENREEVQDIQQPLSIYEVHLGSWKRNPDEDPGYLSYQDLGNELVPYVKEMGYTHIELLPVAEHPYDPSWGYQGTGFYAPTSRFGSPKGFMEFVEHCHQEGIGVIMDWVPAHFAKDDHGLRRFDGTALYEHEDPKKGEHQDWGTNIFNYGRVEVRNFLLSNAMYWFEKYHIDGMRVDAVASMLYLDYSREEGEWIPNEYGGRENIEAIELLKEFNYIVHNYDSGIITAAEESTAWPGVTKPVEDDGLGFDYKWNMGWMNDMLEYIQKEPIHRKYHQDDLTFPLLYSFAENFILPLSHDEVVHQKNSLVNKMPNDYWQKFANLRLLYTYMFGHPGKKLLFMGNEFAQWDEWNEQQSLDWHLLEFGKHKKMQNLVRDLNHIYNNERALYQIDQTDEGFEWIDMLDTEKSIISFIRKTRDIENHLVFVLNFTPSVHYDYKIGVLESEGYNVLLNSDMDKYGGSNTEIGEIEPKNEKWHHRPAHISITIPPLSGLILKPKGSSLEKLISRSPFYHQVSIYLGHADSFKY